MPTSSAVRIFTGFGKFSMPELPEVETTRRGIEPYVRGKTITHIELRVPKLRWELDAAAASSLHGKTIISVQRRGKYLLLAVKNTNAHILIHLGMSGSLRICNSTEELKKHDHVIIHLKNSTELRLHDPRRFGYFAIIPADGSYALLAHLGKEPLSDDFNTDYLYRSTRGKTLPIKNYIMNQKIVVGVGNIYASEALFLSGIRPDKPAGKLNRQQAEALTAFIKQELNRAINAGGTTLRDFVNPDGTHGYFQQTLQVYGRAGKPCCRCGTIIENKVIGGRASAYCPKCQA